MKRFHVHISVPDIDASVRFYSTLFGSPPTVLKPDYAKWMLDEPRVNFAISNRSAVLGLDHLGIQVEDDDELQAVAERLKAADASLIEQAATCCYANSNKAWTVDTAGISWETFHTLGETTQYGSDPARCEIPKLNRAEQATALPAAQAQAPARKPLSISIQSACCVPEQL